MGFISILLFISLYLINNKMKDDMKRLEMKIDKISDYLGVDELMMDDLDEELQDELLFLIENNKKEPAVKRLRDETGISLEEARNFIKYL